MLCCMVVVLSDRRLRPCVSPGRQRRWVVCPGCPGWLRGTPDVRRGAVRRRAWRRGPMRAGCVGSSRSVRLLIHYALPALPSRGVLPFRAEVRRKTPAPESPARRAVGAGGRDRPRRAPRAPCRGSPAWRNTSHDARCRSSIAYSALGDRTSQRQQQPPDPLRGQPRVVAQPRAHSRFPGAVCRQRWTVRLGEVEPVFGQTGRVVLDITARTARRGSKASATPRSRCVPGINCIRPWAPAGDCAVARYPDSTAMAACTRSGSTPCRP